MDYALSVLSAIFPKTLVNNIAFLFSNVTTSLSFNFCKATIPEALKTAPQFLIDNPISLQKKYLELIGGMSRRKAKEMQKAVQGNGGEGSWFGAIDKVRTTLEHMKGRLDLLRRAKEKLREGIRRFEGKTHGRVRNADEKGQGRGRTIEADIQEGVSILWGTIQEKVRNARGVQERDLKIQEVPGGVWKIKEA